MIQKYNRFAIYENFVFDFMIENRILAVDRLSAVRNGSELILKHGLNDIDL
jgi:hypothetical protein